MLEHEHSLATVGAFKSAYAVMQEQGWKVDSVARLGTHGKDGVRGRVYWNAENGGGGVDRSGGVGVGGGWGGSGRTSAPGTKTWTGSSTPTPTP